MIPLFAPKPDIQRGINLNQDREFENELVGALRKRDVHAMELLQQTYSAALYGIIRRIVQDDFGAEKVLQLSLERTWETIEQYDPAKLHLFTWMVSIARMVASTELEDQ
ncbi:sigma factor [Daejeonella lutea]|uniref:sigma factor n=1 Tax=Daejeonella lutea TaxID=572036 RepID=UPI0009A6303C|nr:sigma factor [Daejeonella lutea]